MTFGSRSDEPKKLSKQYKNIKQAKQKRSQIISMKGKMKNFKGEPNKTYKNKKSKKKWSDNSSSNFDYSYLRIN